MRKGEGAALDVACGNGRNSFFLAAMGFEVDAADISDVADRCWLQQQVAQKRLCPSNPFRWILKTISLPRKNIK